MEPGRRHGQAAGGGICQSQPPEEEQEEGEKQEAQAVKEADGSGQRVAEDRRGGG